uniref:Secreted protein n=1 Tax=Rhizophora mucronata TaxID=61149 RepID=A0A2P2N0V9_RHIMU
MQHATSPIPNSQSKFVLLMLLMLIPHQCQKGQGIQFMYKKQNEQCKNNKQSATSPLYSRIHSSKSGITRPNTSFENMMSYKRTIIVMTIHYWKGSP